MDKSERQRLKQLAIDTIIANPVHSTATTLAEALEHCVDEIEDANMKCPTCSVCENHGDNEDDSIPIEASDVVNIHRELKKLLQQFKDYHVKLSDEIAESYDDNLRESALADNLAEIIEETESQVDELEALVII